MAHRGVRRISKSLALKQACWALKKSNNEGMVPDLRELAPTEADKKKKHSQCCFTLV